MAINEIRHDRRKVGKRMSRTDYAPGNIFNPRSGLIRFDVHRTLRAAGSAGFREGQFTAKACLSGKPNIYRTEAQFRLRKSHRCNIASGRSPTQAVKRATIGLMKKIK